MDQSTLNIITLSISLASLVIALFVAGWTVYRDAVQKPKFRVSASIMVSTGLGENEQLILIRALNLGPLPNRTQQLCYGRPHWQERLIKRSNTHFIISADENHRTHSAKGQRVEVGDEVTFSIPYNKDCFLIEKQIHQVGILDGYGRFHWVKTGEMSKMRKQYDEDFR